MTTGRHIRHAVLGGERRVQVGDEKSDHSVVAWVDVHLVVLQEPVPPSICRAEGRSFELVVTRALAKAGFCQMLSA